MARGDDSFSDLRRLDRIELIEIIRALREENLSLERRCEDLSEKLDRCLDEMTNVRASALSNEEHFKRIEEFLVALYKITSK